MTNGFAGSKSLDERRRRRLAQEGLEASGESPRASRRRLKASLFSRSSNSSQTEHPLQLSAAAPVKTRLWREPWKYWTLIGLLLLVNIGTVAFAHRGMVIDGLSATPTVVNWIVDHLAIGYFGLAAGVAWLIFYHRSRSRLDFGGRYRLWLWPAAIWTTVTACALTGWHELFGDWVAGQANLRGWNGPFWCWLIPASALMLSSTRLLATEFIPCRFAWRLHVASVIPALLAVVGVMLEGTSLNGAWRVPAVTLATMLWPTLELGSFLLFARHVVHVTNEPTILARKKRKQKLSLGKVLRKLMAWILAPREELPAYEEAKATKSTRKRSPRRATKSKSRKRRSAVKSRVVESEENVEDDIESEVEDSEESEAEEAPAPAVKSLSAPMQVRVEKPAVIPPPRVEKPVATPPAPAAKPAPPVARAETPIKPPVKPVETRPATQLRADPPQAKRGPHFAQANQRQELEAVTSVRREPERMEDDFGDVEDWEDGDGDSNRHQRKNKKMKGKKHQR